MFEQLKGVKKQKINKKQDKFMNNKYGFTFQIDIYHENENGITITSEYIVVDDKYYKCDRDYCDDFRKLYEEFSEQYSD